MKQTPITLIAWIVLAFALSFFVRLIWVYQFSDYEAFKYADQFMINTNDGYYWAEGARDLLNGTFQKNDLSPIEQAPAQLTYFLVKFLPFSFETIIFYMPAVFSSLIVIPIILIGHNLKMNEVGFLAALLASIAVSYYNRTMVGYYDTDMLNIVFPVFLLWSLILALRTKEEKYLLITALEIIAYRWWYPQSYSLEASFLGLILLYTLIFDRKRLFNYQLVSLMLVAMIGLDGFIRFVGVLALYIFFKQEKFQRYTFVMLGVSIALFFIAGGFSPIWYQLKGYVFKDAIQVSQDALPLHFFSVMQTVREAGQIPFSTFAERISGHTITFLSSLLGYVLLAWRYPVVLLGLPLLGLGSVGLFGGLRFTIYAVPVCALGVSYFLFTCSSAIQTFFKQTRMGNGIKSVFVIIGSLVILVPNLLHVMHYRVPTVFNKVEVEQLVELRKIANREDYVLAWWDYGYPIRYYSDVKTLIDGAKHGGDVNFPVSYALTSPQEKAAKLARFEVEYTEQAYVRAEKNETVMNNTAQMTLDAGFKNANDFLAALETDIKIPEKTRDIYFYLPYRMLSILPTVAQFSNLDVMSGNTIRQPFFYQTNRFKDSPTHLDLSSGVVLDKAKGTLRLGNQEVLVKRFIKTGYSNDKKLLKEQNTLHVNGMFSVIYMQAYNTFLVLDETMFNASYIQLFVLENYDEKLFEPIILEPHSKVFKLKI